MLLLGSASLLRCQAKDAFCLSSCGFIETYFFTLSVRVIHAAFSWNANIIKKSIKSIAVIEKKLPLSNKKWIGLLHVDSSQVFLQYDSRKQYYCFESRATNVKVLILLPIRQLMSFCSYV